MWEGAWAQRGTGWLPIAVSKSITPSTAFCLVYLECMELACQTSALAIKYAMVTIALPCVSATRIGNNHKCQKMGKNGEGKLCKTQGRDDGAPPAAPPAAPVRGRGADATLASSCPFCGSLSLYYSSAASTDTGKGALPLPEQHMCPCIIVCDT